MPRQIQLLLKHLLLPALAIITLRSSSSIYQHKNLWQYNGNAEIWQIFNEK